MAQGLVSNQGIANCRARGQRVEKKQWKLIDASGLEVVQMLFCKLLVAFHENFAGSFIDDIHRGDSLDGIDANEVADTDWNPFEFRRPNLSSSRFGKLLVLPDDHSSGRILYFLGTALADQVLRSHLLDDLLALDLDRLVGVEVLQKILGLIPEGLEENGYMNLSPSVDSRKDQILMIVLDVKPRTAIRNNSTRVDFLACGGHRGRQGGVVENPGRAMKLRNDNSLGAIDEESTVIGHNRNFTEIDLLLLYVPNRLRSL